MRNPKREKELLETGNFFDIVTYARDIIKGRWPEAEPIIIRHAYYIYTYARDVIKGRWPEAEELITTTTDGWLFKCKEEDPMGGSEEFLMENSTIWAKYQSFLKEIGQDIDTWEIESW